MIFHFKITNQTQILDLWFSFFPFRNHKHKHKLTPWRMRRIEPRKKKKEKKWRTRWSEAVSRLWPWVRKMKGAEDCATVRDPQWRGWNGVERVESLGPMTLQSLGWRLELDRRWESWPKVRLSWRRGSVGVRVRTEGGRCGFWVGVEEIRG